MRFKLVIFLIVLAFSSCNRTKVSDKKVSNTSHIINGLDTIIQVNEVEKEIVEFKKAYDFNAGFYYHHYREPNFSSNNINQKVLIEPFDTIYWEELISEKYKLKSETNINGIDSTDIPCGGDFVIPVVYSSYSKATDDTENFNYYILSEGGISLVDIDSVQASVSYGCAYGEVDEKLGYPIQAYTGYKSYFGNLIGNVTDTIVQEGAGFAFRFPKDKPNQDFKVSRVKSIIVDDELILNANSYYEDTLYSYIESIKKDTCKWSITDDNNNTYSIKIPVFDLYYSVIGPNSFTGTYTFEINGDKYLFATWLNDICGNYYVLYLVEGDKLKGRVGNEYNCGF